MFVTHDQLQWWKTQRRTGEIVFVVEVLGVENPVARAPEPTLDVLQAALLAHFSWAHRPPDAMKLHSEWKGLQLSVVDWSSVVIDVRTIEGLHEAVARGPVSASHPLSGGRRFVIVSYREANLLRWSIAQGLVPGEMAVHFVALRRVAVDRQYCGSCTVFEEKARHCASMLRATPGYTAGGKFQRRQAFEIARFLNGALEYSEQGMSLLVQAFEGDCVANRVKFIESMRDRAWPPGRPWFTMPMQKAVHAQTYYHLVLHRMFAGQFSKAMQPLGVSTRELVIWCRFAVSLEVFTRVLRVVGFTGSDEIAKLCFEVLLNTAESGELTGQELTRALGEGALRNVSLPYISDEVKRFWEVLYSGQRRGRPREASACGP
mmetsp:Transcript_94278/g.215670  ORF Transcript_94278/g.215670 Transcript_94278/m.215670 type:complete len:375 (-) Transcript_94278:43-1167(-)